MIRLSIIIFLLFGSTQLSTVRQLYKEANISEVNADKFHSTVKALDSTFLTSAYQGAALIMKAKYVGPLKERIALFKEGKNRIEKAIETHPNDIEVRFIRLTIQQNVPKALRYNKDIPADKEFIFSNLGTTEKKLREYISGYIIYSNNFTEEEKNKIAQ